MKISDREKKLIRILIAVASVFIIYFFIVTPIINYKATIQEEFKANQTKADTLDKIYEQYKALQDKKTKYERLLNRTKNVTSLIEENATACNILNNKKYSRNNAKNLQNKYQKVTTNIKFESVDMKPILDFLYRMEQSGKLISVKYLRINHGFKGKTNFDVTIKIDSYSRK
ncbi:MAG: type II secretion system protein M [bacterium]|nr:type II secretion system protein M [bacterium]